MTIDSGRTAALDKKLYQFLVILCGIAVVAANFNKIYFNGWKEITIFMVFYTLALLLPARFPQGDIFSVSVFADMALVGIFGMPLAVCMGFAVTLFSRIITSVLARKESLIKILGFSAQSALVIGVTGLSYNITGSSGISFLVASFVYFMCNAFFLNVNVYVFGKERLELEWESGAKILFVNYTVLAVLAYIMTVIYHHTSPEWKMFDILLFFVPILLVSHSFRLYINTKQSYMNTVKAIVAAIEANDEYTKGHSERVAEIVSTLGSELGLPSKVLEQLEYLAFLHDVGKIGISNSILNKPGLLSKDEYEVVKNHCLLGAEILKKVEFLSSKSDVVLYHHERYDGKGYPLGLKGENIPLEARILAVADAYDAMTAERPYRPAKTSVEALEEMSKLAGSQFDPRLVDALKRVLKHLGEI